MAIDRKLNWGILATGRIAGVFARGLADSKTGRLLAVGSRTREAAEKFGGEFDVPRRYASYDELLADREVDAVYVSPPHTLHAQWAIRAAEARKHVLCEKPITINHAEALAVVETARRNDVFLMEAFMYRCHPQTARIVQLVREKAVGDVKLVQATFSFKSGFNPEGRLLNNGLGGGGILDVGCYPVSISRLIAGAAIGEEFSDPEQVCGTAHIGPVSRVDEYATASLKFPGGIVAQLATGVLLNQENVVRIFGTEGHIVVPSPWGLGSKGGTTSIFVHRAGAKEPEEIKVASEVGSYALEADVVAANLERRQAVSPAMSWNDTLGNMRTLDRWRESVGLIYEFEKPENQKYPVHRRPLKRSPAAPIRRARIPGLDVEVSRLIMGTQSPALRAFVMFDDFFELGGNCFDAAYIYGGGRLEKELGQWIANRNVREEVVILGKGAHTPHCDPASLTRQLLETLDRLRTDRIDIYCMHRDNPEVPVGEFVDVLNAHVKAGRIRIFGGSNWTIARLEEANSYAKKRNLAGFSVLANNFSLARMVAPPWDGCVASSGAESREWLARTRTPLLPWSSQAQGFFAGKTAGGEFERCWQSEDNLARLERARHLGAKRNVKPTNIALAYVLSQPFPTFPAVGPRTPEETLSCAQAFGIELSPADLKWLNLETET